MYDLERLAIEVRDQIERLMAQFGKAPAHWIVNAVMQSHKLSATVSAQIPEDDLDFYLCASRRDVRNEVGRITRALKLNIPDLETGKQETPLLPGFDRICQRYSVLRDGEPTIVDTYALTSKEIKSKARALMKHGDGSYEHARELLRFDELRFRTRA